MVDYSRINNTMGKMSYYLNNHKMICVSVSGGSDSDVIVHIIATYFRHFLPKIHFVFSNTGVEYKATIRHIQYLRDRYNIDIEEVKGMPIPVAIKRYGVPFVSKRVSDYISRLQSHHFTFIEGGVDDLCERFGKCRVALRWWCNDWGNGSRFNIDWNKGLRDNLIKNPPNFKISAMCCQKSKKDPLLKYQKRVGADLVITGERKSEGGQRAAKSNCFGRSENMDRYMPLFFWDDETKNYYVNHEKIVHSDCYLIYGLKRTGCVGCPFALNVSEELKVMRKYEPNLYKLCVTIFGESYRLMDQFCVHRHKILEDENNEEKLGFG